MYSSHTGILGQKGDQEGSSGLVGACCGLEPCGAGVLVLQVNRGAGVVLRADFVYL
ncbi:MAG: hypothetical protein ACYDHP_10930 [Ferrimicrobium sp.]